VMKNVARAEMITDANISIIDYLFQTFLNVECSSEILF
jgi:hypothetical protein